MSNDFEARRRERLQRQRKQRERMRIIKLILSAALFILVIIIIISGISKCSSKKKSEGTAVNSITATQDPLSASEMPFSTETASAVGIPAPKAGSNDLLTVLKNSGQKNHAYLTFENGPDETITPQILDVLRRYNIKATFFMTGKEIEKNPQLCTRVMQEGHLASVSSYTNVYSTIYSNEATFMNEINKTYELITANAPGGIEPFKLFRFPGGSNYTKTDTLAEKAAEEGFYQCDWNSSNGDDVTGVTKTAENLLFYFNKYKPQLNNLVIQMHDSADKQSTVDMLAQLIEQLIDEGWVFNRLDEIDFSNAELSTIEPTATEAANNAAQTGSAASSVTTATPASGSTGSAVGTTSGQTSSTTTKSSTSGTGSTSSSGGTSSGTGSSTSGSTSSATSSSTGSSGTSASGAGSSNTAASDTSALTAADNGGIPAE
ncbi:MAG: polysaccharide deacetylase family protein [Candidatus Ornithomonoglobus sp.]